MTMGSFRVVPEIRTELELGAGAICRGSSSLSMNSIGDEASEVGGCSTASLEST